MEEIPELSNESMMAIPIEMIFSDTGIKLATATGFFYRSNGSLFIITNWHNLTGINPITKTPLSAHAGKPDLIRFPMFKKDGYDITYSYLDAKLYLDDYMEHPSWLVHPAYKEQVDVVALKIRHSEDLTCVAVNDEILNFKDIKPKIANDVFILGFPYNISLHGLIPIWKRATIATEPDYNYNDKPMILVDTASRKGMSGSPAILRKPSMWSDTTGIKFGNIHSFLGIYSGRFPGDTELEAQLGIIWKKQVIEEIIRGGVKDVVSHT